MEYSGLTTNAWHTFKIYICKIYNYFLLVCHTIKALYLFFFFFGKQPHFSLNKASGKSFHWNRCRCLLLGGSVRTPLASHKQSSPTFVALLNFNTDSSVCHRGTPPQTCIKTSAHRGGPSTQTESSHLPTRTAAACDIADKRLGT